MLAILIKKRTKHACHFSFVRDQVCLPSFPIGTRYACHIFKIENPFPAKHVHFRSNLLWLYDLPFDCASFPPIRFDRKWTCFAGNGFSILKIWQAYLVPIGKDGKHTWSLTKLKWQACLVLFFINMASMSSPFCHHHGKHTWSPSWQKWQPYLVHPYIRMHSDVVPIKNFECNWSLSETNALRCGPFPFLKCTPMWSIWHFGVHSDVVPIAFGSALPRGP